jgi:hypothetical protein
MFVEKREGIMPHGDQGRAIIIIIIIIRILREYDVRKWCKEDKTKNSVLSTLHLISLALCDLHSVSRPLQGVDNVPRSDAVREHSVTTAFVFR